MSADERVSALLAWMLAGSLVWGLLGVLAYWVMA